MKDIRIILQWTSVVFATLGVAIGVYQALHGYHDGTALMLVLIGLAFAISDWVWVLIKRTLDIIQRIVK